MKNIRIDFAVFERGLGAKSVTGYIHNAQFCSIKREDRIKFEGSNGEVYYPKKKEIHTVFPAACFKEKRMK